MWRQTNLVLSPEVAKLVRVSMLSTYVMIYKAFNHGSVRVTIIMAPVLILKDEYFLLNKSFLIDSG